MNSAMYYFLRCEDLRIFSPHKLFNLNHYWSIKEILSFILSIILLPLPHILHQSNVNNAKKCDAD